MAINKSRKVPLARREFRVEMQQRDGDSGSADDRPMCPIQYGSQRAAHAHTILSILRVFRSTYYPQHRLSDVIENMYVALPVFIAHVAGRPATASQIARTLGNAPQHRCAQARLADQEGLHHATRYEILHDRQGQLVRPRASYEDASPLVRSVGKKLVHFGYSVLTLHL
jgi:hypothetical protein